jgi:pimeloyl-ACP methyl ester carboxylesterase
VSPPPATAQIGQMGGPSRHSHSPPRPQPAQPVAAFVQQSNAVIGHDVEAQLGRITAPTQITFGRLDLVTSRFAGRMNSSIRDSELLIFEGCAHAPLYEKVEEFNQKTLAFLRRHTAVGIASGVPLRAGDGADAR